MATFSVIHLQSSSELRSATAAWDELWLRSATTLPTARASLVAHWIDSLAKHQPFHVLAIERDGHWLAAIPLVEARLRGFIRIARLPCNEWSAAGDLLVDPQAPDEAIERLVDALVDLSVPLLWFDGVPVEQAHWQRLLIALRRRRLTYNHHERFRIGVVDLTQDWASYEKAWSGNFRRQMRKMVRRADEHGELTLAAHLPTSPTEIVNLLQMGFEIEDRSWKGRDGTSVLKTPIMHAFLCQQALHLAELGHLELHFLDLNGRPIAFEYGMVGKGWYFSPKVGYDQEYAHFSPGQLLRLKMMERFFPDPERTTWDFLGPLVDATDRWTTSNYAIKRLVIATNNIGRLAVRAYRDWWPAVRSMRDGWRRDKTADCEAATA